MMLIPVLATVVLFASVIGAIANSRWLIYRKIGCGIIGCLPMAAFVTNFARYPIPFSVEVGGFFSGAISGFACLVGSLELLGKRKVVSEAAGWISLISSILLGVVALLLFRLP